MSDGQVRRVMVGIFMALGLVLISGCGDIVIAPDPCECGVCPDGSAPIKSACPSVAPFCVENFCSSQCPVACTVQICGADPSCGDCGVCVNADEVCKSGKCECVPACDGLACGDDGCGGQCGECPEGTGCRDGACEDAVCTPEALFCDGETLIQCDGAGLGPAPNADATDCGAEHSGQGVCEETDEDGDGVPDTAACVCAPACDGLVCGDDGCGGECGACDEGTACLSGACEAMICTPGELFCSGGALNTCDDVGLGPDAESTSVDCASEHEGQGACEATDADEDGIQETASCVCVPACADKDCASDDGCGATCGAHICADGESCYPQEWDGADGCMIPEDACGYEGIQCGSVTSLDDPTTPFECTEKPSCDEGLTCVDNQCICVPACEGKQCGDDGCDGTCGTCDESDYCDDALQCVSDICVPNDLSCSDDGASVETCDADGGGKTSTQVCAEDPGLGNPSWVCTGASSADVKCDCAPQCDGKWCGAADGCAPTGDTSEGYACGCGDEESCFPEADFPDSGNGCLTASAACASANKVCGEVVDASGASHACGACDADNACVDGACLPVICVSGALICQGVDVATCNETGTGAEVTAVCSEQGSQLECADGDADTDGLPDGAACVCVPQCDGKWCNEATGCEAPLDTCDSNQCAEGEGCFPKTDQVEQQASDGCMTSDDYCQLAGKNCGTVVDGFDGSVSCGVCDVGDACNDGVCCTPECGGKVCGGDGCGGVCGDCSDDLLCSGDGQCLQCLGEDDCSETQACVDGSCLDEICQPFSSTCISTSVSAVCDASGTGHVSGSEEACSGDEICDGESCKEVICDTGGTYCQSNNEVQTCNDFGTGPLAGSQTEFCGVGSICVEGQCLPVICTPNLAFCDGPAVRICDETGTGPDKNIPAQECTPGTFCVDGACTNQTCTPGGTYCEDNAVAICNQQGTGPDPLVVLKGCDLQGPQLVCEEVDFEPPFGVADSAECVCEPACDGKECGDDGCDSDCGPCAGGQTCTQDNQCVACLVDGDCGADFTCVDQACVALTCTPLESYCLSGSVLGVCNANGTGHVAGSEQSCTGQGEAFICQDGACVCDSTCDPALCGGADPCSDYCSCAPGQYCDLGGPFPEPLPGWMSMVSGTCVSCEQGDMWCSDDGLSVYQCDSLPLNGENPFEGVVPVVGRVAECDPGTPCVDNEDGTSSCGAGTCVTQCGPTNECGSDGCGGTCGECAFPATCGAITPDMCGCVLNSCEALGLSVCGSFDDGCGGQLQCSCPEGEVCTALQLCAPDETGGGEPQAVGCSDGTREGFLDTEAFPKIAACGGGWAVPGIHHGEGPSCGRLAGDDSANDEGLGCNVEDLCSEGWHVCYGDEDVSLHSPSGCEGIMDGAESPAFFLSRATTAGGVPWVCAADTVGTDIPVSTDDLFGCGDLGCVTDSFDCKTMQLGSHNGCLGLNHMGCECGSDPAPTTCGGGFGCTYCYGLDHWEWSQDLPEEAIDEVWECSGGGSEAHNVIKSKASQGGVLCCLDTDEVPGGGGGGCVPQCGGLQCGDDGCGGSCGSCTPQLEKCVGGFCQCLHPPFCL